MAGNEDPILRSGVGVYHRAALRADPLAPHHEGSFSAPGDAPLGPRMAANPKFTLAEPEQPR
jgi:hypothetical protein